MAVISALLGFTSERRWLRYADGELAGMFPRTIGQSGRNKRVRKARLRQCSLYDPSLDLAVEAADGRVAGYALFWFDQTTLVGLLEPMRVEDEYQRRGLARMLLTNGLDRLGSKGARRLKVGFETDAARNLYLSAGFVQTSTDRLLVRPAPRPPHPGR
jgi:predicted N-acetyltransferase YhbS